MEYPAEHRGDQMEMDNGYWYTDAYHILPSATHPERKSNQIRKDRDLSRKMVRSHRKYFHNT